MIEGIEILNKTEIMDTPYAVLVWGIILIAVGLIGVFVFSCLSSEISKWFNIGLIFCAIAFFTGIFMFVAGQYSEPTGRYQYEVTIDETVPFEELYKQYDVIEQRGSIWVLEDKEKGK